MLRPGEAEHVRALALEVLADAPALVCEIDAIIRWYCRATGCSSGPTRSFLHGTLAEGRPALVGAVRYPWIADGALAFLEALGIWVADRVVRLPCAAPQSRFGFAATSQGVYEAPDGLSAWVTEVASAEPLFILQENRGWALVECPDGYMGWVPASAIVSAPGTEWLGRVGATAGEGRRGKQALAAAWRYLGVPYVWGGTTNRGIDCSGLVHRCYAEVGIFLPRDARWQALCGRLVATRDWQTAWAPGDLLFFLDHRGAAYHVALAIDANRFLHARHPAVREGTLTCHPAQEDADLVERFAFARRVLA